MDPIRGYRDLLVWQKAMLLVTSVYEITQKYPTSEQFTLTSRLGAVLYQCRVILPRDTAEIRQATT
jgi:hypothetical protein